MSNESPSPKSTHDPADRAATVAYLRALTEQVERGEVSGVLVVAQPAQGAASSLGWLSLLGPEDDATVYHRLLANVHRYLALLIDEPDGETGRAAEEKP